MVLTYIKLHIFGRFLENFGGPGQLTPLRHIPSIVLVETFSFLSSERKHLEACDLAI